ncbi:unnamed protein product [Effrenium voratum]|nr:unnamed protein product [Effrenium voratum]
MAANSTAKAKVRPRRLHAKTCVKKAKAKAKAMPRQRRYVPKPAPAANLTPQAVMLPQLAPCDVLLEYKQFHVKNAELEVLLPRNLRPCPLKLGTHKMELPLGAASAAAKVDGGMLAALNAGCCVSHAAWAPNDPVLALGVLSRTHPSLAAEGPVPGTASLQLWRVDFSQKEAAHLRMGIVHEGAGARSLQWLPSKNTKERLGLLLAMLSNGDLRIYSLPLAAFQPRALSRVQLFARFVPAWVAQKAPQGAQPAAIWQQRHLQCAAARASSKDPKGCVLAAGTERCVVLLWRMAPKGQIQTSPSEVLRPCLQEMDMVTCLAFCPGPGEILAAGLSSGYVILWDLNVPAAPLRCFIPGSRGPMLNLTWADTMTLLIPPEAYLLDLRDARMAQFRCDRTKGLHRCLDVGIHSEGFVSVWNDGVVNLKPQPFFARTRAGRAADSNVQSWIVGGVDVNDAPFPDAVPLSVKEEGERQEYLARVYTQYQHNIVSHFRVWEKHARCFLEIGPSRKREGTGMPLTCALWRKLVEKR